MSKPTKPRIDPPALAELVQEMARLRADAAIQFERIAQLQAQVDLLAADLARLKRREE